MDFWKNIGHMSKEEFHSLQSFKLHEFINTHVYPFSPHYQALFKEHNIDPKDIKTVEDLKRIPFTSKADLVSAPGEDPPKYRDFILQPDKAKIKKHWPKVELIKLMASSLIEGKEATQDKLTREYRPVFMTFTTGTTGGPTPFLYSNYDLNNLRTSGARMLQLFKLAEDERLVNIFPFAPHLAVWQVVFGGIEGCRLAISTGGGKVMGTDGNIAVIEKIKPKNILGVPSYIYHVLREAEQRGVKMPYLQQVVLGASRVTPLFKKKIEELITSMGGGDVSVMGTYGFTEARCAWSECPTSTDVSSGYHLYPDKEIFEIIDPKTGEVKGEGEDGEIVYTSLDSRGSVMLRYRTGDYAKGGITYAPCPHCGLRVPRLSTDITRLSDIKDMQLSKVKGSLVNFSNFDAILSQMPMVKEWQVEIRKKNDDQFDVDELHLYITPEKECNQEEFTEEVKKKVSLEMEVSPNGVHFIELPEMVKRLELETANKEKRILDKRPKD